MRYVLTGPHVLEQKKQVAGVLTKLRADQLKVFKEVRTEKLDSRKALKQKN